MIFRIIIILKWSESLKYFDSKISHKALDFFLEKLNFKFAKLNSIQL